MRFTIEKYPLLYKGSTGDEAFNFVKKSIQSNPTEIYYTSKKLLIDAADNKHIIECFPLKYGQYLVVTSDYQLFVHIHKDTTMYDLKYNCMLFVRNVYIGGIDRINNIDEIVVSKFISESEREAVADMVVDVICVIIPALFFIKVAPISTKTCPPKRKLDLYHCKYKSDIDYPITICDEAWYTECAQKMPFWVRRHLRNQPFGPGRSDRKLIWINAHIKRDYTKGALKEGKAKDRKRAKLFGVNGKPK